MKKNFLKSVSLVLAISLLSAQNYSALANSSNASASFDESVFSYDEDALLTELNDLNDLDAYLETNEGTTFAELSEEGSPLIADIESTASPMGMGGQDDGPPLGIPSFLWGCVFGIIGLVVVYIMTDENKDETKKALWGCVASTLVSGVIYMVAWGAWAASETTY